MIIYESEKSLGDLINSKTTAKLNVPIKITDSKLDLFIESLNNIKSKGCGNKEVGHAIAKLADEPHPDLMYGSAILVSTVVNLNDDVFLPDETWAARYTPINTPYNNDHKEEDIIGHIIAAKTLDKEGKEIVSDEPPPYFDIEVDFVVYKDIFPAIAEEIADKGPKGEKFVSMEAKFSEFDYALIDDKNQTKIYARNDKTSFLSKYLRAYGGEGKYETKRIARVLRNFRFSGMGNVDVPGNPASEYTKLENYEFASASSEIENGKDAKVAIHIIKGKIMEINTLEQAKTVIADLNTKLEKYEGKEGEALKDQIKTLASNLEAEKAKVALAKEEADKAKKDKDDKEEEAKKAKKDKDKAEADLKTLQDQIKLSDRIAKLKEVGMEVAEDKKNSYAQMSDDVFASVLDFAKSVKAPAKDTDSGTNAADVAAASTKAKAELDNAQPTRTADVTNTSGETTSEEDKVQKTAAKLANALTKHRENRLGGNRGSKSNKKE